jgi:quercetin dioxygenase-like cupin family protein
MPHYAILRPVLAILRLPLPHNGDYHWRGSHQQRDQQGSRQMRTIIGLAGALASASAAPAQTGQPNLAKPNLLLQEVVAGMPKGDKQEVRVLTATFKPGDQTVYHTHRFPVTVYVLEGTFTLELDGRPPIVVKAGEALVEPPRVPMTGYNRSATETTKVVIFYVADPGTPFIDLHH